MTTNQHPNLIFGAEDVARIKKNIETYDWARALFEEVKGAVDGGADFGTQHPDSPRYTMTYPDFDITVEDPDLMWTAQHVHMRRFMEFAMVAVLTGEEKYSHRMVRLLPDIAEVLARGSDPNKQAQVVNWTTGQDAADALIAYDLLYNDPSWTEAAREKVEGHFQSIGKQIEAEPSSYHLCNTSFYYQVYRVLAGCFFDNREWIDTGLDNPGGFKSLLTTPSRRGGTFDMRWYLFGDSDSPHRRLQRFRGGTVDDGIWNETGSYGLDAVLSQMCFIAEAMLHYDGTNLYEYEAPGGGCLRNVFRRGMERSFSDGQPIRFGANGEVMQRYVPDVPGSDGTALRVPLPGDKWDLAYLRCGDPEFAWAALQVPGRRGCANKWGYCALWHGLDASEMEVRTPDMRSITFPGFGVAVVRSTEGPEFWNSDTPTVAVRWGEAIYRAHPDQFGFQLHAFGRGIEPDINYPWDYGVPQGGRNPTPFGYSTYAHNCLVVDRRNYSQEAANLVVDDHGEHAKVIGLASSNVTQSDAVQSVDLARWLVLCKEYLLDVSYIGDLHLEHTFDLSVPTFGTDIEIDGAQWEDYDVGADIGYGKIDTIHDLDEDLEAAVMRTSHPPPAIDSDENVWLKDGRRCKLREPFTVRCKHPDGIHLALHYGGWSECEMMTAKAPLRWLAREGVDSIPGRFGLVINRKVISPDISGTGTMDCSIFTHSEDHCHYFVVHEPYREQNGTKIRGVRRLPLKERTVEMWDPNGYPMAKGNHRWTTPRVVEVQGEDFIDYFIYIDHFIALRGGEPGRTILTTPAFRVEFSGPYVWLRRVGGKISATQGKITEVDVI